MSELNFDNFFTAFDSSESLALLIALIIAYILGILTGLLLRGRRVRQLKKELAEKEEAVNTLQARVDELNQQMAMKDADLQKVRLENEDLYTRIRILESDKQQLQTDLNATLDQMRLSKASKDAYEATITDLTEQLNLKEGQLAAATATTPVVISSENSPAKAYDNSDTSEVQALYAQTKNRLELLENKINKLESENAVLQEDLQKITQGAALAPEQMDKQVVLGRPRNAEVIGGRILTDEAVEKDDLTLINGLGPFLERKLNEIQIYTYEQISTWSTSDIESITKQIGFFPGRIEQDNWVGQAARLQQIKVDNPKAFTKEEEHPSNPKDLKIIAGIGPKTEELLKNNGVRNWVELASTDVERLRAILRDAGAPFDTLNPSTWPEQARLASNGEWERFEDYQGYLGVD
ncbi:MAG: helix-hairpin-helix domain-containing protein [Bacteroidota bacterium]